MDKRNKRALILLAVAVVFIVYFNWIIDPWMTVRTQLDTAQKRLVTLEELSGKTVSAKQLKLAETVPVFEMPGEEEEQRLVFMRSFSEQLQKSGVRVTSLPEYQNRSKKRTTLGVKEFTVDCKGTGRYDKILDMVAKLYENPYVVSIEAMTIKCGSKKREDMEFDLSVSTFMQE